MNDRWLPPNHQLKRRVAAFSCLGFGAAFLFVTPWGGTSQEEELKNAWNQRSWEPAWCLVKHVGVADRGTCDGPPSTGPGPETFAECPRLFPASRSSAVFPEAVENGNGSSSSGSGDDCDVRGNLQFRSAGSGSVASSEFAGDDTGDMGEQDSDAFDMDGEGDDAQESDALDGDDASDATDDFDSFDDMDAGRRLSFVIVSRRRGYRRRQASCHRNYVPWAEVLITSTPSTPSGSSAQLPHRCAYEFGASEISESSDREDAADKYSHLQTELGGTGMQCWVLAADDCVVSFTRMGESEEEEETEKQEDEETARANRIRTKVSIVCGVASLIAAALSYFWYVLDYGFFDIIPPSGYQASLPMSENEEEEPALGPIQTLFATAMSRLGVRSMRTPQEDVPLSARIRRIVDIAATGALGMATPSSGGESLRLTARGGSRRTVQVAGPDGVRSTVSRNIAADFLAVSTDDEGADANVSLD